MSGSQIKHPTFFEAFRFWLKLGFISFGGPTAQIAIMHEEIVDRKRWISEERFLHALNYCMLLPGPEAQQLAIYIGWLLHRIPGGLVAGILFILPSVFILLALSWIYMTSGHLPEVSALLYGLKATIVAIVAAAAIRIGQKILKNNVMILISILSFVGMFFLHIPFPILIVFAGLIGWFGNKILPQYFNVIKSHGGNSAAAVIQDHHAAAAHTTPNRSRTAIILCIGSILWIVPLVLLKNWSGNSLFFDQAQFFSKAAMVTFGGAYAVLPYIAQAGVEHYHWLTSAQMMDGLGLAETTPGPLIMVVCFLGFVGGWQGASTLSPQFAGIFGGLIATYFTFLPCFLWIFLGAPYVEKLRGNLKLNAALSAITAAVVGVILNLAIYFAQGILWSQHQMDWMALAIAVVTFVGTVRFKWKLIPVIALGSLAGFVWKYVIGAN